MYHLNNDSNKRVEYDVLTHARVTDSRNVVISACSRGGYTVAQQLVTTEGNNDRATVVFLKGAIHVDSLEGLYNLRDALNVAITMVECETEAETPEWDWDEEQARVEEFGV